MKTLNNQLELGMIICKHCNKLIGTQDTNRVAIIYGVCSDHECCSSQQVQSIQGEKQS